MPDGSEVLRSEGQLNGPHRVAAEMVSEWQRGWRVLMAAALGVGMTYGLFLMTAGLFIVPMQREFGWSRTALSIGPIVVLIASPMMPIAGWMIGRYGARVIALIGIVSLAVCVLALSLMTPVPAMLYGLTALIAVFSAMTSATVYTTGVVSWFSRNAGAAIGLTLSGVSLCGMMMMPVLSYVINQYGWRVGFQTMAASMLLIVPLVALYFRERERPAPTVVNGSPAAALPGHTFAEAMRDARFWALMVALNGAAAVVGGFMSQLMPMLESRAFTPMAAAILGSTFSLSMGLGRIVSGFLLDHVRPSLVTSSCLGLPAFGVIAFALMPSESGIGIVSVTAIALIGLAQGAEGNFLGTYAVRIFGQRSFSTIFGVLVAANSISLALGGLIFSLIFDELGSYEPAMYVSAAVLLISSALMMKIRFSTFTPAD